MSDLSITAASVLAGAGATVARGVAGASVTAGETVYFDGASSSYKLADCNSGTAAARSTKGITLHAAATGQPLAVHTGGPITIGATLTAGVAYYQSATPGGICPVADLVTGCFPVLLGIATSASVLNVDIQEAGVAL